MTTITSRKPDPVVAVRLEHERRIMRAALLVRDAAAVRRVLPEDCTAGLYVGAVDRLIAAAERMEVEA